MLTVLTPQFSQQSIIILMGVSARLLSSTRVNVVLPFSYPTYPHDMLPTSPNDMDILSVILGPGLGRQAFPNPSTLLFRTAHLLALLCRWTKPFLNEFQMLFSLTRGSLPEEPLLCVSFSRARNKPKDPLLLIARVRWPEQTLHPSSTIGLFQRTLVLGHSPSHLRLPSEPVRCLAPLGDLSNLT